MDTRAKATDEHLKKLDLEVAELGNLFKGVSSRLENKLESTNQNLQVLVHRQEKFEGVLLDLNQKYENLVALMALMSSDLKMGQKKKGVEGTVVDVRFESVMSTPVASNDDSSTGARGEFKGNTRLPEIDFPLFGGEGPREWLREARKYFQHHQTPDELRLRVAEIHLEGKAYVWFYGFIANHPGADWSLFSDELCRRFSETIEEEVIESFSKIRPLGTMAEHQENEASNPEKIQGGEEAMEISIGTSVGSLKHKTITVPGIIKGRRISILIDSGSTHSFVDEKLNYAIDETNTMTVSVDNGDKLESKAVCQPLVWRVQDWEFQFNLRTLKLGGSDMVLGVNWKSQFGPIIFDFVQGYIKCKDHNNERELRSETPVHLVKMMEVQEMERLCNMSTYGVIGHLSSISEEVQGKIPSQILEVIQQFPMVFEEPRGLPPPRSHDDHISLKEGAQLFRIRPYRCRFIQKTEIERLVGEMRRYKLNQQLKENLSRASTRVRLYADKKRLEQLLVGEDWVFLKLLLYAQKSVERKAYHKLSAKYFGSYQIIKKIREVAYQSALPEGSKIHPTFHVSLLKKKLGNKIIPTL